MTPALVRFGQDLTSVLKMVEEAESINWLYETLQKVARNAAKSAHR